MYKVQESGIISCLLIPVTLREGKRHTFQKQYHTDPEVVYYIILYICVSVYVCTRTYICMHTQAHIHTQRKTIPFFCDYIFKILH